MSAINSKTQTKSKRSTVTNVQYLKGIGPARARALSRLGYKTMQDLFYLFPRRYEDRTKLSAIKSLKEGDLTSIKVEVVSFSVRYFRGRGHFVMTVKDESGAMNVTWFNQPYLKQHFKKGDHVILYGRIGKFARPQFSNPEYEKLETTDEAPFHSGRITPVYPLVSGLYQRGLRRSMWDLLEEQADTIKDYLPEEIKEKYEFMDLNSAVREIHFPSSFEAREKARERIVFDEFFLFEIRLLDRLKRFKKDVSKFSFDNAKKDLKLFIEKLPFQLTRSQQKVMGEIVSDLKSKVPMTRLLQGDVGSGKTVVAASFFEACLKAGYQAAFLAPTETLAEQHYQTIYKHLSKVGRSKLALLKGSLTEAEKNKIRNQIKTGEVSLVVGTHALIQDSVEFKDLAFLVIDEQHKFGVEQRSKLINPDRKPHLLLMTATPIPRTLAMTLYGDLDISVINEMPKGRKSIKTYWAPKKKEEKAYSWVRERLEKGEQGYFVYPAIEESDKSSRISCVKDYEKMQKAFKDFEVGLIHGQMSADEKREVMLRFMNGEIQILLATTVIEVGIDNPNATFVIIKGAEYFGLSGLHQIRGRVGRGEIESICFLFGEPGTEEGKKRFEVITKTNDGFVISEEDLKLRGPGDFLGTRQSGIPLFKLANLILDQPILEKARSAAHQILDKSEDLSEVKYASLKTKLKEYSEQFYES